jgi:NDP-sugar pyrophosphorylase family protein
MPDAILLCGGAGLRLRSIMKDAPKAMASIVGRPFLELLLRQLRRHGFQRAILAVGYQSNVIQSYFGERVFGLDLTYSVESSPLGTGGALRNAADLVESDTALVMNGDSYTEVDLGDFVADYHQSGADASVVVAPSDGRGDCGSVRVDGSGKLSSFEEKQGRPFYAPYLNAGIYMVSRYALYEIPPGLEVSLERELLPRWLREGKAVKGFVCLGRCVDIGTPERYRNAQGILGNVEIEAGAPQRESPL